MTNLVHLIPATSGLNLAQMLRDVITEEVEVAQHSVLEMPDGTTLNSSGQADPETIGYGLQLDFVEQPTTDGMHVDLKVRADIATFDIDSSNQVSNPLYPAPCVWFSANVSRYDESENQTWLFQDLDTDSHLHSADMALAWSLNDGWFVEARLNDARFEGAKDWLSTTPNLLHISSRKGVGTGAYELVNAFLNHQADQDPDPRFTELMQTLSSLGLASEDNGEWTVIASSVQTLLDDPTSFISNLFSTGSGKWDMSEFLSCIAGFTARDGVVFTSSNYCSSCGEEKAPSIPSPIICSCGSSLDATGLSLTLENDMSIIPLFLNIHPTGSISIGVDDWTLFAGLSLDVELTADVTKAVAGTGDCSCSIDAALTVGNPDLGALNSASLEFFSDLNVSGTGLEGDPFVVDTNMTLNLSLPNVDFVPAIIDGELQWASVPDSYQLYPSTGIDAHSMIEMLATISPGLILQSVVQTIVDELLLEQLPDDKRLLVGAVLENLGLAVEVEVDGVTVGHTTSALLPAIYDPVGHVLNVLGDGNSITPAKCLSLITNVTSLVLPDYCTPIIDGSQIGVRISIANIVQIDVTSTDVYPLTVIVQPATPIVALPTSAGNAIELDINFVFNILNDHSVSFANSFVQILLDPGAFFALSSAPVPAILSGKGLDKVGLNLSINTSEQIALDLYFDFDSRIIVSILPTFAGIQDLILELLSKGLTKILPTILDQLMIKIHSVEPDLAAGIKRVCFAAGVFSVGSPTPATLPYDTSEWSDGPFNYVEASDSFDGDAIISMVTDIQTWLNDRLFGTIDALLDVLPLGDIGLENTSAGDKLAISKLLKPGTISNVEFSLEKVVGELKFSVDVTLDDIVEISRPDGLGSVNLDAALGFHLLQNGADWTPSGDAAIYFDNPIFELGAIPIQPGAEIGFSPAGFGFWIGTDGGTDTNRVRGSPGPSGTQLWLDINTAISPVVAGGYPNLLDLLSGIADAAIEILLDVEAVKDFLENPMKDTENPVLNNLLTPGKVFCALDIFNGTGLAPYSLYGTGVSSMVAQIDSNFSKPLEWILGAIVELSEVKSEDITLFDGQWLEPPLPFNVDLVYRNGDGSDPDFFAIQLEVDQFTIHEGDVKVELISQSDDDVVNWTKQGMKSGLCIGFLEEDTGSTPAYAPLLSISIAGIGVQVSKANKEPLLDNFLYLTSVGARIAFDSYLAGTNSPSVEVGASLVLDDFGISLGGNGEQDGGNGMAAGVLTGGDGEDESVKPVFDIELCYFDGTFDVSLKGETEFWFPVNKEFGPLKIEQIGVRYEQDTSYSGKLQHRLGILVDGSVELAGFLCQVDDLEVNFPLLKPQEFESWFFDMAGLAIAYTGEGGIKIAGALRKAELPIPGSTGTYIEYQGLCTITLPTFGISAMGAFGRVPNGESEYITAFVIAALDMPLGGPPFFFITGLMGGLGLNRDLILPDIHAVPQHPFMTIMNGGFADNPMGALQQLQGTLPAKYGSFWFCFGLKFTTFQVVQSRAVLFIKLDSGVTVGILGLSAMSLPSKEFGIGYVELAFLAYYSSEENVLWIQAELTNASYLFHSSCQLTGGFAMVTWFNTGEFVLSLGGYHKNFQVPSYYPTVSRLGFIWKPSNSLCIKGGTYFTVCTSAVMLGGRLEASYKSGCISAGFWMNMDVLIVFDPFHYEFDVGMGVYVRVKTWLGTLKFNLSVKLFIEGPKMRGVATIEVGPVEFKVKFGSTTQNTLEGITGRQFINKHIRQLPESIINAQSESGNLERTEEGYRWADEWCEASVFAGSIQPTGKKEGADGEEQPQDGLTGLDMAQAWQMNPEFDISFSTKFPSTEAEFFRNSNIAGNGNNISESDSDDMELAPMLLGDESLVTSKMNISIQYLNGNDWEYIANAGEGTVSYREGLQMDFILTPFPETIWDLELDGTVPAAKKKPGPNPEFYSRYMLKARCEEEDGTGNLSLEDKVEPCEEIFDLPLSKPFTQISGLVTVISKDWEVSPEKRVAREPSLKGSLNTKKAVAISAISTMIRLESSQIASTSNYVARARMGGSEIVETSKLVIDAKAGRI